MNPDDLLARLYPIMGLLIQNEKFREDESRKGLGNGDQVDYSADLRTAMVVYGEVGKYLGLRKAGL